jgi:hypothetical protein
MKLHASNWINKVRRPDDFLGKRSGVAFAFDSVLKHSAYAWALTSFLIQSLAIITKPVLSCAAVAFPRGSVPAQRTGIIIVVDAVLKCFLVLVG